MIVVCEGANRITEQRAADKERGAFAQSPAKQLLYSPIWTNRSRRVPLADRERHGRYDLRCSGPWRCIRPQPRIG
jgi:hypothetical protein